jgi:alkylation response protein AidB-like acyl-CoA dehydrogenase
MAKALLGHERTLIGGVAQSGKWVQVVKRIARDTPVGDDSLLDDPAFRRRIARLEMRHRAVNMVNLRTLAAAQLGHAPGAESSILKIVGTELYQEITELTMDALGHGALGWQTSPDGVLKPHEQWIASEFNYLRATTIYGGSNEVQRNIIAKAVLGLPMAR